LLVQIDTAFAVKLCINEFVMDPPATICSKGFITGPVNNVRGDIKNCTIGFIVV